MIHPTPQRGGVQITFRAVTAPGLISRIPGSHPALRSRNFRLFIIGQLISYTGSWLQTVAQGWLVLQLSNSAFIVGLVTALGALPILLFTLYGGVLADRVNRRKTVMVLQALLAVEALALAILVVLNHVTVGWIMGLALFTGLVTAFEVPIRQSMVAELSGRESLMNAIALQSSVFNLARVLGPAFAGVIIGIWGVAACFFLNAASFFAVIWGLWRMDLPHTPVAKGRVDVIGAFKEGARYVRHERWPQGADDPDRVDDDLRFLVPGHAAGVRAGRAGDRCARIRRAGVCRGRRRAVRRAVPRRLRGDAPKAAARADLGRPGSAPHWWRQRWRRTTGLPSPCWRWSGAAWYCRASAPTRCCSRRRRITCAGG